MPTCPAVLKVSTRTLWVQGRQLLDAHGGHLSGQPPRKKSSGFAGCGCAQGRADGPSGPDLVGPGDEHQTVMSWELEPMRIGDESSPSGCATSSSATTAKIGSNAKTKHRAFFRILLPTARPSKEVENRSRDLSARRAGQY